MASKTCRSCYRSQYNDGLECEWKQPEFPGKCEHYRYEPGTDEEVQDEQENNRLELITAEGGGMRGNLTEREKLALRFVGEGMSNKEIAEAMGIAEKTVEVHLTNANHKLLTKNRQHAALAAKIMESTQPKNKPMGLKTEILSLLSDRPATISMLARRVTQTRHEERIGKVLREMASKGEAREVDLKAGSAPGYVRGGR